MELNGTSKSMSKVLNVANDGTDEAVKRNRSNYNAESCAVPALRVSPKHHKKLGEDGIAQTRPIVGASSCMAARASEIITDVLDCFVGGNETIEVESTQEMLAKMNVAEYIVEIEGINVIGGSTDLVAMFTEIKKRVAGSKLRSNC